MFPLFVGDGTRCVAYSATGVDPRDCVQSSSCRRLRKLEVSKNPVLSNRLLSLHRSLLTSPSIHFACSPSGRKRLSRRTWSRETQTPRRRLKKSVSVRGLCVSAKRIPLLFFGLPSSLLIHTSQESRRMRQRDEDHTFLHPRIRAIEVPCPCSAVSPRVASILSTGGLTVIYLMWAIGVWKGYFGEHPRFRFPTFSFLRS